VSSLSVRVFFNSWFVLNVSFSSESTLSLRPVCWNSLQY
jgi:hypothetical protein